MDHIARAFDDAVVLHEARRYRKTQPGSSRSGVGQVASCCECPDRGHPGPEPDGRVSTQTGGWWPAAATAGIVKGYRTPWTPAGTDRARGSDGRRPGRPIRLEGRNRSRLTRLVDPIDEECLRLQLLRAWHETWVYGHLMFWIGC